MASFPELFDSLDPDANIRGRQFERIVKWWLLHDPVYRSQIKRVWLWDEWPGRWGADAGIDLVGKTTDGDLWAIQAKAYSPEYRIKKSDVDSFLSESARPQFSYRLLVATTNRIGRKALRTLEEQEKPSGLKLASDLNKAQLAWPATPDDLRAPPPVPKDPFPHNQEAIADVVAGFEKVDRGQLIMACGTGKTLVGLWVAEQLEAQRTLVLVPSLSLLTQTLREWTANTRRPFAFLPVCSDETVRGDDHLVSHTAELGMPVTTDPTTIAGFLRKRGPSVVFATYQSSGRIAEAYALGRIPKFGLVIADEAHRVAGPVSSDFAIVLDPNAIRSDRRLFMTATPRYFTGKLRQEAKKQEFVIASMDDEVQFGPVLHQLSFGEAIERELLSDYQVAIVGIDSPTYRQYVERGTFVTRDGKEITDARTLAAYITVAKAMRDLDLRRTISFHSRIAKAKSFATEFPGVVEWMPEEERPDGNLVCDFVSGEMSSGQREVRIDRLRYLDEDERGLLSNARCLGEGVDVPALDGVAFIDPKASLIDIIQAVGRTIRKTDNKTIGTIVLPVFIDDSEDPEAVLTSSAFRPIWDVLKALRAHDEQLAEQLDSLRRQIGRKSGGFKLPPKLHIDLPATIGEGFSRAFEVRLVEATTASWEYWFGLLKQFIEQFGHARVPAAYRVNGSRLGSWVNTQRHYSSKGTLTADREVLLESTSGWVWDLHAANWEEAFESLSSFADLHGHALVGRNYEVGGVKLGIWVNLQRRLHSRGELEPDRVARLELVPGWAWDAQEARWDEGFAFLGHYIARERDSLVPRGHEEDGFKLGSWVGNVRQFYKVGRLSQERASRLEAIHGWVWDPYEAQWERKYELLLRFRELEGHATVPADYVVNRVRLGSWVNEQKTMFKREKLESERLLRLEAIDGWAWNRFDAGWLRYFKQLERHVDEHGTSDVPSSYTPNGLRVGQWAARQRSLYRNGNLRGDRVGMLEALADWIWEPFDAEWLRCFELFKRYVDEQGSSAILKNLEIDGSRIGEWVVRQRFLYGKGELRSGRAALLEGLPGWAWAAEAVTWEENFEGLKQFVDRQGHANVPQKPGELSVGLWVARQRDQSRQGNLEPDRVARLEALPGWTWDPLATRWEERYADMEQFVDREGHARVPKRYRSGDHSLGYWVTRQRDQYRQGNLEPDRVARLQALPGWTWRARGKQTGITSGPDAKS